MNEKLSKMEFFYKIKARTRFYLENAPVQLQCAKDNSFFLFSHFVSSETHDFIVANSAIKITLVYVFSIEC